MSTKRRATTEMNYSDISIDDSEGEEEMAPGTASFDGGDILESAFMLSGVIGRKTGGGGGGGGNQAPPKRKRQKLTHLTEEEKMMRRKLKNRMAAQSARDRKKCQMDDLEKLVLRLEKQNAALMKENQSLRATISSKSSTSSSTKCSKRPLTTTTIKPPSSSSSSLTRELLDRISSSSSSESAERTDGGLGSAPIAPPPIDGDKMLHMLDRLDDDFLAQITHVIVGESGEGVSQQQRAAISSGEATLAAAAHDQPVDPQLLPSTAPGRGVYHLVGSAATSLESSQDNGCQGLNTWIPPSESVVAPHSPFGVYNAPQSASGAFAAPVSSTLSLKHHLLDHMYACQEPANFEDAIISDSDTNNDNPITNDENADLSLPIRLHSTEDINIKARKRKRSSSSDFSTIADSAYDSPSASTPSASTPPASPRKSPSSCSSSPIRDSPSLAQTKSLSHQNQTEAKQLKPPRPGSLSSINVLSSPVWDDGSTNNTTSSGDVLASTLDLDLLDSLLSKDVLNDMGQVILNEELTTTTTKSGEDVDDEQSRGDFDLFFGNDNNNGKNQLFAGLFGDALKDEDDLVKDFDTSDWESTFNELFPQL